MSGKEWDVFISHASEDKNSFVRPLAKSLRNFGVKVWYDEFTLSIGDSLSRSIDKGLINSNYGIVVLSPNFLQKDWPEYELRGLFAKEIGNEKLILPIWHEINREQVLKYSAILADKFALSSTRSNISEIVVKIIEVVRPDIISEIHRKLAYFEASKNSPIVKIPIEQIISGPVRHKKLDPSYVRRIRLIRASLLEVWPDSMDSWLDSFKRDLDPGIEIKIWERIAASFCEYNNLQELTLEQKKAAFEVILELSFGLAKEELETDVKILPINGFEIIRGLMENEVPPTEFDKFGEK